MIIDGNSKAGSAKVYVSTREMWLEKENAELKARLAHVESELKAEQTCLDEISRKTEVLYPSELQKLARQRIKERKEFL